MYFSLCIYGIPSINGGNKIIYLCITHMRIYNITRTINNNTYYTNHKKLGCYLYEVTTFIQI